MLRGELDNTPGKEIWIDSQALIGPAKRSLLDWLMRRHPLVLRNDAKNWLYTFVRRFKIIMIVVKGDSYIEVDWVNEVVHFDTWRDAVNEFKRVEWCVDLLTNQPNRVCDGASSFDPDDRTTMASWT